MVLGIEKIEKCDDRVKKLVEYLYDKYHHVTITSGYRSVEDNAAMPNSSKKSQHCLGLAVDIVVPNALSLIIGADILTSTHQIKGFGIDIYKNYCHFDFRSSPSLVVWTYGRNGKEA